MYTTTQHLRFHGSYIRWLPIARCARLRETNVKFATAFDLKLPNSPHPSVSYSKLPSNIGTLCGLNNFKMVPNLSNAKQSNISVQKCYVCCNILNVKPISFIYKKNGMILKKRTKFFIKLKVIIFSFFSGTLLSFSQPKSTLLKLFFCKVKEKQKRLSYIIYNYSSMKRNMIDVTFFRILKLFIFHML